LWIVRGTLIAAFLAVLAGLARTQLGRSDAYAALEQRQNLRRVLESAPRGAILDRDGRVLARDRERIDVVLSLAALRGEFEAARHAARLHAERTGGQSLSGETLRWTVVQRHVENVHRALGRGGVPGAADFARHYTHHRLTPFVIAKALTEEEVRRMNAASLVQDPVRLRSTTERVYPEKSTAAHVIGRTRKDMRRADSGMRDTPIATPNYRETLGDFGVEKQFDDHLRGRPAKTVVRVDAAGLPVEPALEEHGAQPGGDLVLSLDLDLQRVAERALNEITGASHGSAVVVDVATGELLVLASKPGFDLNAVSPSMSVATKQRIDEEGGWLNRATQGVYPPGSTFKIFTVLAGLREGTLHPEQRETCEGSLWVGGHRFVCHNPEGHGTLPLRTALAQSCNVFAYRNGLAAGASAIAAEARRFHFDAPTGIELPGETRRMFVPNPSERGSGPNETWTDTDTINLAIGQGSLRISPLQAACAMASLARRETLTVPTLLRQPGRRPTGGRAVEPLDLSDRDYAALLEGLRAVVEVGIGQRAQVPGIGIAGKTGTAQIESAEGMRNVAWFLAFAPIERPEIAIAVALEGDRPGEEFAGAEHAAPIVREIIAGHLDKK
jgi:penicillin-binding protein 2